MNNRFKLLGIVLSVAGVIYSPIAFFILKSTTLSAIGISAAVVGLVCLALADASQPLSAEYCHLMLKTGYENTAALIEEIGATGRAIYLPASIASGKPRTLVPLNKDIDPAHLKGGIPSRLIVRYGPHPEEMAISVLSPGSAAISHLEARPGPTAQGINSSLNYLLVGFFDVADTVEVTLDSTQVFVNVARISPGVNISLATDSLGSPLASIAAAVTAEALGKCISILEESLSHNVLSIKLGVIS